MDLLRREVLIEVRVLEARSSRRVWMAELSGEPYSSVVDGSCALAWS